MTVITVQHTDDSTTHYQVGSGCEYRWWRITARGLLLKRWDGTRRYILPASMCGFDVAPGGDR